LVVPNSNIPSSVYLKMEDGTKTSLVEYKETTYFTCPSCTADGKSIVAVYTNDGSVGNDTKWATRTVSCLSCQAQNQFVWQPAGPTTASNVGTLQLIQVDDKPVPPQNPTGFVAPSNRIIPAGRMSILLTSFAALGANANDLIKFSRCSDSTQASCKELTKIRFSYTGGLLSPGDWFSVPPVPGNCIDGDVLGTAGWGADKIPGDKLMPVPAAAITQQIAAYFPNGTEIARSASFTIGETDAVTQTMISLVGDATVGYSILVTRGCDKATQNCDKCPAPTPAPTAAPAAANSSNMLMIILICVVIVVVIGGSVCVFKFMGKATEPRHDATTAKPEGTTEATNPGEAAPGLAPQTQPEVALKSLNS